MTFIDLLSLLKLENLEGLFLSFDHILTTIQALWVYFSSKWKQTCMKLMQDIPHSSRVWVCFFRFCGPKRELPPERCDGNSQVQKRQIRQGAKAAPGLSQVSGFFFGHFLSCWEVKKKQKILRWVVAKDGGFSGSMPVFGGVSHPVFLETDLRDLKQSFQLMRIWRFDLQTIQPHDTCINPWI